MSNENTYKCHVCRRSFTMSISNVRYPGEKEQEYIDCPWYGAENGNEVTSGTITTNKVLTEGGVSE